MPSPTKLTMHEAILAGASTIRSKSGTQFETQPDGSISGCALGMANVAAGAKYVMSDKGPAAGENPRSAGTSMVWGRWVKRKVARPCDCTHKTEKEIAAEAWKISHARGNDPSSDILYMHMMADRIIRHDASAVMVFRLLEREMAIEDIIPHLFDCHVTADPATWTIEQLADWVKSVEPEDELEKMLYEMPWPTNWMEPYHHLGIDWSSPYRHVALRGGTYAANGSMLGGAMTPGNEIDLDSAALTPTAEITLADLQRMTEILKKANRAGQVGQAEKETTTEQAIEEKMANPSEPVEIEK